MVRRSTWILLLVFIALLAAVLFWQRSRLSAPEDATPTPSSQYLFDIQDATIQNLALSGPEGKAIILEHSDDGKWLMKLPEVVEADSGKVDPAVGQLVSMRVLSTPDLISSLEDLGLAPPIYKLSLTLDDGRQFVANIGKATPTGSGYYVLSSGRVIYVVSKVGLDSILALLDTPPYLPTQTPAPATEMPTVAPATP